MVKRDHRSKDPDKHPSEDNISQQLGSLLREARNRRSLSQSSLSDAANINSSYYCSIERGTANLTVKKFLSICDTLQEKPSDIMLRLQHLQEEKTIYNSQVKKQDEDDPSANNQV